MRHLKQLVAVSRARNWNLFNASIEPGFPQDFATRFSINRRQTWKTAGS